HNMARQHEHAHLVQRQRNQVETVVSVRYVTASNTYTVAVRWETPPASGIALPPPMVRPQETSANGGPVRVTSTAAATSKKPSATPSSRSNDDDGIEAPSTPVQVESTLKVATQVPTPNAGSAIAAASSAAATISAGASANSADAGMSTGAKAGIALGVLLCVCALLTGILLLYRRKKKQQDAASQDNEKIDLNDAPRPLPPQVQAAPAVVAAPSIRTQRTLSTAPRLSLRPVTQFDPAFENRKSAAAGNLLSVAGATAPPTPSKERDLPDRPRSAWERPGAANVAPAENPFNDPQQLSPPSANPFGNDAALDPTQAQIPNSPPNASPLHSTQPSADFANPAVAIASADINPVLAATAMASVPPPTQDFPAPPSIKAPSDGVPASPAWTEDFPASPGPAPVGPPPVAGAVVGARSNSPAPPAVDNVHRVQLDFKPSMQDELGLHAGQLVRMLHEYDDGWALCIRMDRSQQGVVPRTCLSKHPVKPRTGPPRQGPPPPGMRGPPIRSPMGPGGIPQPRPLSPASGRNSPHPPGMSPGPHSMSPGPRQMSPQMQGSPRSRSNSNAPQFGPPRGRSNSNAPYAGPPRSMSPGPYGGGPQMAPPPQMGRPRANSASQLSNQRRGPAPGPSPMNPNGGPMPPRKPVPGMAM
ncbi:hypothetical protein CC86DRAFT_306844, partial [Ophiobolus disseminans]